MKLVKIIYHWLKGVFGRRPKAKPHRSAKEIALEYCREHPEARASIIAAGRRLEEKETAQIRAGLHRFTGSAPWARCIYCETPREAVAAPECVKYRSPADIRAVIRKEESLFEKTLVRARKIAANLNFETVTGEELARIHHTHGVDPSMIEAALDRVLPERLAYEYAEAYERHKATGRSGQKREILVAKTATTAEERP